jgi:hypothetical protein
MSLVSEIGASLREPVRNSLGRELPNTQTLPGVVATDHRPSDQQEKSPILERTVKQLAVQQRRRTFHWDRLRLLRSHDAIAEEIEAD